MMKKKTALFGVCLFALMCTGCGEEKVQQSESVSTPPPVQEEPVEKIYDFTVDLDAFQKENINSGVSVHDPSIFKDGDTYYLFGSHMSAAKGDDLFHWEVLADGYKQSNTVYGQIYDVAEQSFAYSGSMDSIIRTDDFGTHVWAPHVIYNKTTGLYNMYYCTSSTWNASNLCFGSAEKPEGPYIWQKPLLYSGFDMDTVSATDVLSYVDEDYVQQHYVKLGQFNSDDYPNCIDPTVFYDKDDRLWMVYGSWSGGIFLLELDPESGEVIHPQADLENDVDPYYGKRLLGGGHLSIEGPYILYDEKTDYYYLFVSYGWLEREGGYQIRVLRSKTVDGPYVDMNGEFPGKKSMHCLYGLKLSGNYILPSVEKAYMATGHNSAFIDDDGKWYVVYHTRFDDGTENHSPRVHQLVLNEENWPCELPYQTRREDVSTGTFTGEELAGKYYIIDQGILIDSIVAEPDVFYLEEDGSVKGENVEGSWEVKEGSYYMNITLKDKTYQGVFAKMQDEAGVDVTCFSAVGENHSIWGVSYKEDENGQSSNLQ